MKKVAVFGNAGGGKSTLSKRLSEITGLPLHVLDKIKYQSGGREISAEDYKHTHEQILATDRWIIDGFGCLETLWLRLNEADSLVYIDLPLYVHFWWVTKRFITGYFRPPAGWPEKSPIFKSSINSYRVLWRCHQYLTPKYREYIEQAQSTKRVYHLRSIEQISQFFECIENETCHSFEFRCRIDDVAYRYHPCEPFYGQSAWKREDLDLWVTKVNGHGWVCVNAELEILAVPWTVAVETQGSKPPAGIWVSRKGDKSYVYEVIYL